MPLRIENPENNCTTETFVRRSRCAEGFDSAEYVRTQGRYRPEPINYKRPARFCVGALALFIILIAAVLMTPADVLTALLFK